MPRWKALPDELDPQVKEFAVQLRRLVDRSGLGVAAVADRTGYSRTSWERYLNGRLLAPKGAVVALAEVTGTSPVHLATMWELAERAWSRSEMRHDMTMEAIRISQARAALGEFGPPPVNGSDRGRARGGRGATATPGAAGTGGGVPSVPRQPTAADVEDSGSGASVASSPGSPSGGASRRGGGRGTVATPSSGGAGRFGAVTAGPAATGPARPAPAEGSGAGGSAGSPAGDARPAAGVPDAGARRRRRLTTLLAGVGGALVVAAAAVLLLGGGGDQKKRATPEVAKRSASVRPDLPAGVKCGGEDCTGKDPEKTGCGGRSATTPTSITVGTTLVEVRYSGTCGAAWARITRAVAGDSVVVSAGDADQRAGVKGDDTDAYTPMVAVGDGAGAKACVTLGSGQRGCTR
ncbi:DUF2690 domain-containing protein [Streptomyces sp. NPDC001083]|uniref:helix-turn-helix domain-containing protein n=1 Tax=Streptomyces sp. NPDC001083 TaxID=3364545 RepID=UPI00368253CD